MAADSSSLLLVADSLGGGLGAVAMAQAAWFRSRGWRVTVAAPPDLPDAPGPDHVWIPLPPTVRNLTALLRAGRSVQRIARAREATIVHCHGLRSFAATMLGRTPAFVTLHGFGRVPSDPPFFHRLRVLGLKVVGRTARGAISATPDAGSPWTFLPHASPRLAQLGVAPIPTGVPTFLWCGRLAEPKRPDLFVKAIARAATMVPVRGWILGDGPLSASIEDLIRRTGAPVDMLGFRHDPGPLLEKCWAVALFSRFEALTFAVQEAMWVGRTVIASDLTSLRYLVGDTGILVGADPAQAAKAILELCDRGRVVALGHRAARRIRRILSPDSPWPDIATLYGRCLSH